VNIFELDVPALIGRELLSPKNAHRLDRLVETTPTIAVGHADRFVFLALPSDPNAESNASPG
jgi:hypothetical protein